MFHILGMVDKNIAKQRNMCYIWHMQVNYKDKGYDKLSKF